MPALVFPATGFTTSTQFTSTFATFSITVPGKVASRAKLKSIDSRSFGKVLPRSNIRGPVDRRQTFGKVLPRSNIRGFPVYITPPKITTFKVGSNSISSIDNNYSIVSKLSPFVNLGLTSGPRYAAMLSTIVNDNVGYTIYDRDILTSTRQSTTATQTLYFNPERSYLSLTFTRGDVVNIVDSSTTFSAIVEINTSTVNSITFNTISGLPNTSTGGLSIQSASDDLYPTSSVLANYYAKLSSTIQITPTYPRENLALSQIELPSLRYRSRKYYIDRELADTLPLLNSTTNSLSTFSDTRIPGDFRLTITGQTDQNTYNTVLQYINDLDLFTYTTSTVNVKVISFPSQDAVPFPSGSTVRIINSTVGYTQDFTVIIGTGNSVSFTNPNNLPVGGLTIEKTVASVYPQSFVSTRLAPTNARENLYYFNISPGLRSAQQYFIAAANTRLDNGNLSRQLLTLKSPTTQLSVAKLSSAAKLKADSNILRVNKLGSAAQLRTIGFTQPRSFVSTITQFYSQITVAPSGAPTNARENFFYFNLAPGLRANRSITNGEIFGNSFLPRNLGLVKQPQSNLIDIGTRLIKTGNLKSTAKLIADTSKFSKNDYISILKIKSNTVQFFETPTSSKLVSVTSLKSDRNIFTTELIQKPVSKLVYDNTIFKINNLSNVSKLTADGLRFNDEQIDVFKVHSNTTQMFETPRIGNIKPFSYNFTTFSDRALITGNIKPFSYNFTTFSDRALITGNIKPFSYNFTTFSDRALNTGNLKSTAKLIADTSKFSKNDYISILKIKSNTVQFFETPTSSKLVSVTSLKSDRNIFTTDKLSAVLKLKAIDGNFNNARLNEYIFLRPVNGRFNNENISVFKIHSDQTEMFETPRIGNVKPFSYNFTTFSDQALNTGNLKSTAKLIAADRLFNSARLNDYIFLRPVNGRFNDEQIDLLKIKSNTVQFFETPTSNKLVSVTSLKSDRNIFRIDKLSAMAVIRADKSSLTTGKLKSSASLKEYGDSRQLYRLDSFSNYIDQTTVRPITAPTNPSERFYYFNLAPGYRRNSSIQDGKLFSPISNIIKNDRLELFDNIGYQLDLSRIYDVSGQTTGVTANTVLFYQNDLDILTTTTAPIDTVTIFFGNTERTALPPFLVGDTVYVTKNQDVVSMPVRGFVFTVIANAFNSITIAKPADWDTTWAFSTIQLTGAEYYPRAKVRTTVAPTNAREALYYAELGPGIRTNRTISYGNSLADTVKIKNLDAKIFKYVVGNTVPGTSGFIDISAKLVVPTLIKLWTLRESPRKIVIESLTKDTWKLRATAIKDSKGIIIKFTTGDGKNGSNGFIDTGATKKEPIQFWN